MRALVDELHSRLEQKGYRARSVSVEHLRDLQSGIESNRALLNDELYQEYLAEFVFRAPNDLPNAKSVIVVAVPRPQVRITFTWQGRIRPVIVPPNYTFRRETEEGVETLLSSVLNPEGYHVAGAALPLKYLAVCSGLGSYGRNNICYVEGMGSFHRLVALYTDLPTPEDNWQEPQMMERCLNCQACLRSCVTGAISKDRFLLRAERCLTFHNERLIEFPDWINSSWHNALIGCLRCQIVCPQNIAFRKWIEGDQVFSEEETALILNRTPIDLLPGETVEKLRRADLSDGLMGIKSDLARNLTVLLRTEESRAYDRLDEDQ